MTLIGYSTGALAYSDFEAGLRMSRRAGLRAVELSALRERELAPLMAALDGLDLEGFDYVSVHAPSRITPGNEQQVVELLRPAAGRGWPIIVHPDVIETDALWATLGRALCIENNDRRKSTGKSWRDLHEWFERFPDAGFCLDLGHARQVDLSMTEAYFMLKVFRDRLVQLHVSDVTTRSRHERLSALCVRSFRDVAKFVPRQLPIIVESVVLEADILNEVAIVQSALRSPLDERTTGAMSLRD
jgi:hypothetical protein